jgi:hypothetical protein
MDASLLGVGRCLVVYLPCSQFQRLLLSRLLCSDELDFLLNNWHECIYRLQILNDISPS